MKETSTNIQARVAAELEAFPPQAASEFEAAWDAMSGELDGSQVGAWVEIGLKLAGQAARSWEAAAQYFRASPIVVGLMPFNYFVKWSECGLALCSESPTLATCYFSASPGAMARLRSRHIESWSNMGLGLYKGTWKSGTLACKFFESSPALLSSLSVPELERFVAFLDLVANRSYDLSTECLSLSQKVFPHLGDDKDAFISLASKVAESNWRQVKGFFEASAKALPIIETSQRPRFLSLADRILSGGGVNLPAAMLEVSESLEKIDEDYHERLLELADGLMEVSPAAAPEFIKSTPSALERVTIGQLEKWFDEGMRVLRQNQDGGMAYFKVESSHTQQVLEALSSSVEFERVHDILELYCRALAGAEIDLAASDELVDKSIGWVSNEAPSTEGSTVYIPSNVDRYTTKDENYAWVKVVSTHQVAHLEFGSFRFDYDQPSTLFSDLRPQLSGQGGANGNQGSSEADADSAERGWATHMQRFFDIFDDRKLALDIFTVVEDGRLDSRVKSEYAGIRRSYVDVQQTSLGDRPEITELPAREALVEFLVRLSLYQYRGLPAPKEYVRQARKIARAARRVTRTAATVEDAAEATLRIYAVLSEIPNEKLEADDWETIDVDGDDADDEEMDDEALQQLIETAGSDTATEEEDQDYEPSQDVDYRGDFKPELAQLLSQLRLQADEGEGDGESHPITQEMLEGMLENSAELDLQAMEGGQDAQGSFAENMLKEVGLTAPDNPEYGQGPLVHVNEDGGSLDADEPQTFAYDEWDFRAEDYKPRWCIVRQKNMAEGDHSYYGATLNNYGPLVRQIRRQFELMVPEVFRKVRKLEDGEEIDIDDVIEAFVDIRTGVGPSEKLFWRRNKVQRDVAVVFLLDTSASTAEAIDESRKMAEEWAAPDDPVEYMAWLRTRRGDGARRSYKRIIDLEKEAVVLLIDALEAIGDIYGIYGFSGYGRENVEFYTIKDINEVLSEKVKKRIDRVSPLHATRMGPAIRHATTKLEEQDARTKLLFLISDGRPQDRGYSREGVEKEYAVHDTKMALDEARDKDITAFCLTVDKNGHDYLKTMCEDIGYEVLDDIYKLPERLLFLYKRLTM